MQKQSPRRSSAKPAGVKVVERNKTDAAHSSSLERMLALLDLFTISAPVRPVTLNNGYRMRAWYDIVSIQRGSAQDEAGIRASHGIVESLIRRENERGIASSKIVLAGFSQGGAMALYSGTRYPEKLAGIMGLSCYMLLETRFSAERVAANHSTSVFLGHGTQDPVVSLTLGEATRRMLETEGYSVEWHAYPMPHSVCPQEVLDIATWLRHVI